MASWEIGLHDKSTGKKLIIKTDGSAVTKDRVYILPDTGGNLLTQEHLENPANFPAEFKDAIRGKQGTGISSITWISTTDISNQQGKPGATDTYRILLSDGTSSQFTVTNGQTTAEINSLIDSAVATLVGSAPASLDTLQELAQAINNNSDFYNTIIQTIGAKADSNNVYTKSQIDTFVAGKIASTEKGAANGVATLGADGKVPSAQLPSYVDDVLEFTNLAGFPATGESSKIYVDMATNKTYRWSGSVYTAITSGAVDSVNGQTGVVNITTITGNAGTATKLATARTIAIAGDATGSASFDGSANASMAVTLANSGVVAGTYNSSTTQQVPFTVDAKGRVTAIGTAVTIAPAFSSITGKPTTVAGYGITDAYTGTEVNTLLAAKVATAEKGAANGVATLGADGKVPTTQLPAYVDDVLEYTALASFPATGETSKIYVDLTTNKTYRWSGSAYIYITSGAVDSVNGQTGVVNITTITGNAGTATKLATARSIGLSGDASGSASFDGSANATMAVTLANSGVVAGTYNNSTTQQVPITVDAKGRVTAIGTAVTIAPAFSSISGKPTTIAGYGITDAYTKSQIDTFIQPIAAKADSNNVYTKSQIDTFVAGLKTVPQVSKSAAYTLALTDGGSSIDTTADVTIPLSTTANFPIGAIITVTNMSASTINITPVAGVTLHQAGTTNTGARTLAAYGLSTLRKVATDTWLIAGAGVQ